MKSNIEIEMALKQFQNWRHDVDGRLLEKEFEFKSYLKTISFVNAVAWLSNKENHHPELVVTFNKCIVRLTTHDEGGVGEKDFSLAKKIDSL